jgi:hypothetical protein
MCPRPTNQQNPYFGAEVVWVEMWTPDHLLPVGPHIQLPNVMHVAFQTTASTHVECVSCRVCCWGHHRMYQVSVTCLPKSPQPVPMSFSLCYTHSTCAIWNNITVVYNYVFCRVWSISVLVLAVDIVLFFYPAIKGDFHLLVTSASCVVACFVSLLCYNLWYVVRPSCK